MYIDRASTSFSLRYGPQEARPFKATRRVWEKKNPLDFFHVCPLLLHEKMGGGAGRPVYKLVFACPGRAGALVSPHDEGAGFCFLFLVYVWLYLIVCFRIGFLFCFTLLLVDQVYIATYMFWYAFGAVFGLIRVRWWFVFVFVPAVFVMLCVFGPVLTIVKTGETRLNVRAGFSHGLVSLSSQVRQGRWCATVVGLAGQN